MASNSSLSSSPTSSENLNECFYAALAEGDRAMESAHSSQLNYLDSLGSKGRRATGESQDPEPESSDATTIQPQAVTNQVYQNWRSQDSELESNVHETRLEQLREFKQRQVLVIIAIHLMLLTMVDFSLQIFLMHCGTHCPSPNLLHTLELALVMIFPFSSLIFLRFASCCRSGGSAFVLMCTYSILFALFFFGVCDLMFGPTKAHRDIALILFTLTVCFILFSLYVYSKNSSKCLYLALGILTLTVVLTLGLLLVFPALLEKLPHRLEAILAPNRAPAIASVWVSYGMALIFAITAVSLTTLMFTALRGFIFRRNYSSLDDGAFSTAVEVLLRMEMFFVVWPFEIICKLFSRCSASRG